MTRGHEQTDIEPRHALAFAAGLVVFIGLAYAASLGAFHYFAPASALLPHPNIESELQRLPEPRLQISPQDDLEKFKSANRQILETYGWVDRENNIVRIPIERAMDIAAERGLPDFTRRSK